MKHLVTCLLSLSLITAAGCDPDDGLDGKALDTLTDDEFVAVCDGIAADLSADAIAGARRFNCALEVDCAASATAVEDCAAEATDPVLECTVPSAEAPIRDCALPVSELDACFGALYANFEAYADLTCATLDTAPAFPAIEDIAACDTVRAECPGLFEADA